MNFENTILALFYARQDEPIQGKNRLMLYLFLTSELILKENHFKHTSYYYGPWHNEYAKAINELKNSGFILASLVGHSTNFILSTKGLDSVRNKILKKHITLELLNDINSLIRKYDDISVRSIVSDIRCNYEPFFYKTVYDHT